MGRPLEMVARIDWTTDTPRAWIKDEEWKKIIISQIDAEIEAENATILRDAVNGPVRIDRLLWVFQQTSDISGSSALSFTTSCLKINTIAWIQAACEVYEALWWEVIPICFVGTVSVKVEARSDKVFALAADGFKIEGLLGSWFVNDKGYGSTLVGASLVEINIQLLVSHPDLIEFHTLRESQAEGKQAPLSTFLIEMS